MHLERVRAPDSLPPSPRPETPTKSMAEVMSALELSLTEQLICVNNELIHGRLDPIFAYSNRSARSSSHDDASESSTTSRESSPRNVPVVINPMPLYLSYLSHAPYMEAFEQNDVAECFHILIDRVSTEVKKAVADGVGHGDTGGEIARIFRGTTKSHSRCGQCSLEADEACHPITEIQLDIPARQISAEYYINLTTHQGEWRAKPVDIADCVQYTLSVSGNRGMPCHLCGSTNVVTRSSLTTLPPILALNLNRAHFNGGKASKMTLHVELPPELDMQRFMSDCDANVCTLYELVAIIVHEGSGSTGGHYTCYSKRESGWKHFNDAVVTDLSSRTTQEVISMVAKQSKHSQPCLLLYSLLDDDGQENMRAVDSGYERLMPGHIDTSP